LDKLTQERLENALSCAIASLRGLLTAMDEEHSALGANDPALLDIAVARKAAALANLESESRALVPLVERLGLGGPDQIDPDESAARPETMTVAHQWRSLQKLLVELRQKNLVSGQLANQKARSARAALSILTGRAEEDHTYRQDDGHRPSFGSNSLAKA
jgi:flagellar biosynthesis/type III secretory pathway chaperone